MKANYELAVIIRARSTAMDVGGVPLLQARTSTPSLVRQAGRLASLLTISMSVVASVSVFLADVFVRDIRSGGTSNILII